MLAIRAPQRTFEGLWQAGVGYHSLRQGDRLSPPEESLGVQRTPLEEATFERPSDLRLDFELSIRCRRITFADQEVAFAYLTGGGKLTSREFVGRRWSMSPARVGSVTDSVVARMVRHCGGRCGCR